MVSGWTRPSLSMLAILIPEALLNQLGYLLIVREEYENAIAAFELNISNYPGSANVYDSLGECYETMNKLSLARVNYEKAYELLPAASSYQAIKEIRHNIAVQEFNLAAEQKQAEENQRERELKDKIDRWNQFIEQE